MTLPRNCDTCRYRSEGRTTSLCTSPNHKRGPEPLFYAILKCGSDRDWWEALPTERLPLDQLLQEPPSHEK